MIKSIHYKILLSFIIFIAFFFGKAFALIGLIIGSIFLINELIQRKIESIGLLFLLMYLSTGLKSVNGFPFQFIEGMDPDGNGRGVFIFILPEYIIDINLGIFDLSLSFILGMFFFSHFIYILFNRPNLFSGLPKPLIVIFVFLFIPTFISFFIGNLRGINGSLAALKTLFGLSVVFYGYTYARLKTANIIKVLFLFKKKYIYVLAIIQLVGLMYNHILFIYLGVAAAVAVYVILFDKNIFKFLILLLSIFMGTLNNTITILLIPLVSGLVTFFAFIILSSRVRDSLPKLGFILYILFLGYVLTVPKQDIKLQDSSTTEGRLYNKIYGDRFFVWSSYMEEIKKANLIFVIPKETIKLETIYKTEMNIFWGAHNSLIQLLYYYGAIFGSILFIILFYIIDKMIRSTKYLPKFVQAIALGLFSVFIVFGLTGHSIITHQASLFFWLFVGLIAGLGENTKYIKEEKSQQNDYIKKLNY